MAKVTFPEAELSVEVPPGTTLLEAARLAGVIIEAPCNGAGSCGKCLVQVEPAALPNLLQKGRHRLPETDAARGLVLSCEAEVVGDLIVRTIQREQHQTLRIISSGVGRPLARSPFIAKSFDATRDVTRVMGGGDELALESGNTTHALLGVVVDIGTTTLSASLVDLLSGRELACAGALNPQSHHAQDVLSRIRFAASEEGLRTMHAALIEEIRRLIGSLTSEAGIGTERIYELVFSGNTCMLHLATAENPASLGKFPYHSRLSGNEHRPAESLGLPAAPGALVYLPPVISAFVGPDITSGLLATSLASLPGGTLLVDIGTNGEMVIGNNGRLFATSTAAGPAFEGMNIGCGMRASAGAIESFSIGDQGTVTLKTIGDQEAVGICGSGLMDIVAQLFASGVVSASGRFCAPSEEATLAPGLRGRLVRQDGKPLFRITEKVSVSQKDLRQVQLAKGAIRAGIEFLLGKVGLGAGSVDRVLIAGSFGYHLQAESLLTIGLLPPEFAGKIEFVGNTSQSGGEAFLLNEAARTEMAEVVTAIEVVDLASFPDFDRCFVQCLGFGG